MQHQIVWGSQQSIGTRGYKCGWCGHLVSAQYGYGGQDHLTLNHLQVYPCPHCGRPSYFEGDKQYPLPAPGASVPHVPADVNLLYEEARRAASAGCPTAAVLLCRKLLMNLGVSLGASEGLKFIQYVEYLAEKNYVPPNGKAWVDHIRAKGNEATHEIALMEPSDADDLISFSEMLLKFIFEFPKRVPSKPAGR